MNTITAEQVEQFMREAVERLEREAGNSYVTVKVGAGSNERIEWETYVDGGGWLNRKTYESAIADQVAASAPAVRAADLKSKAAKLLAEAVRLEAAQ